MAVWQSAALSTLSATSNRPLIVCAAWHPILRTVWLMVQWPWDINAQSWRRYAAFRARNQYTTIGNAIAVVLARDPRVYGGLAFTRDTLLATLHSTMHTAAFDLQTDTIE